MWRYVVVVAVACRGHSAKPVAVNDRCETDSDCAIVAQATDACCPRSGTPLAMTLDRKAQLSSPPERTCSQDDVVACPPPVARDNWPDAVCKDHACAAQKRVAITKLDLATYRHTCTTDADCTLVQRDRCNPCRCDDVPIAAGERGRYVEAFDHLSCGAEITIAPCAPCDALAPVCRHGTCDAVSTETVPADAECRSDEDCVVWCADESPCETVISKTALAAACKAANCRPSEHASNVTPRCKAGKCFAAFDSGLPAR